MDKLTRLQAYRKAREFLADILENTTDYRSVGFCYALYMIKQFKFEFSSEIADYPELMLYKPVTVSLILFWFPTNEEGIRKRIQILDEIIEHMFDNLKK